MSEKKRPILVPQYIKNFKCIGSACEDSCCIGWRVDIDHETYRKYQNIRDEELTPLLNKYVTRNRTSNSGDANYAKVKLLEDSKCPFLNEEMLCRIQLKRGEEYLSDVCTTYPRNVNIINGVVERSATMSCPEVARVALLNFEGIEFDEEEEATSSKNIVKANINTHDLKLNNKVQRYLWEIRIFTITALQNRDYKLSERLIILGLFFQKLQEYIAEDKTNEIEVLITAYTNLLGDGSFHYSLPVIPVEYNIQMELLKEITDKRYFMGVSSKRYIECLAEFLAGIQYTAEAKLEEIGQRYHDAYKEYYEPFMSQHEYIMENYLVNYVFKNIFPFTGEKTIFDSYMMLILHYSLIKMHLIGMAGFHKGLTTELVIKLIQSFAKTVEHNQQYLYGIADLMRQKSFNTLPFMTILIKN